MKTTGNYKHGGTNTRLYVIWKSMRQRCGNPNNNRFYVYGAKGISIVPEWDNYETFREWAESNGYSDGLTIDRIDANRGYGPENCRWVSQKVQQNNRTNNRRIVCDGEIHTLTEWAEIVGIRTSTLHARISKGWSADRAIHTPVIHTRPFK